MDANKNNNCSVNFVLIMFYIFIYIFSHLMFLKSFTFLDAMFLDDKGDRESLHSVSLSVNCDALLGKIEISC